MSPHALPWSPEWWDATTRRVLLLQSCQECGRLQHYPRSICLSCGSDHLGWVEASGNGSLYSFTVSHRSPDPERFEPPYVLALVDLDEGPRILSRLLTDTPESAACDQRVRLTWLPLDDGRHLPAFAPNDEGVT